MDINKIKTGLLDGKISVSERKIDGTVHTVYKLHGREMFAERLNALESFRLFLKFVPQIGNLLERIDIKKIKSNEDLTTILVEASRLDMNLIEALSEEVLKNLFMLNDEGGRVNFALSPDVFFKDFFEIAEITFLFVKINFFQSLKWRNLGSMFQGQKANTKAQ